jgi:hypothetical protein
MTQESISSGTLYYTLCAFLDLAGLNRRRSGYMDCRIYSTYNRAQFHCYPPSHIAAATTALYFLTYFSLTRNPEDRSKYTAYKSYRPVFLNHLDASHELDFTVS